MKTKKLILLALATLILASCTSKKTEETAPEQAYVFSYFDNNTQAAGLLLAYSYDGLHWTALNDNKSTLAPEVGKDKLMRDPSICQGPDGTFHMVWTSSWTDKIIGYASSKDLVHWSEQKAIPVMEWEPRTRNSWAPELYYDADTELFWIFWASSVPGAEGIITTTHSEDEYNHRIYCTTTKDFETFSETKLWFNPLFNAIDAAVVKDPENGELIMAVKNEGLEPLEKNIRISRAKTMAEGFDINVSDPILDWHWLEGPSPIFIGNDLVVFFDKYSEHKYGAVISHDHGYTWEDITDQIEMPEGMSHGTAFKVDKAVVENLIAELGPKSE